MTKSIEIIELEKFVLNNPELEKLESLLNQFNIFDVLNIVHTEIRHSSTIAWLLDPNGTHGLGHHFLKLFLKYFISNNKESLSSIINLFTIEFLNLNNVEIRKEWNHIDIMVLIDDKDQKIVIAIENKIKTKEHGNQLHRYRETIEKKFPDYTKLYIYLSPDGLIPSDENWSVLSYSIIADIIEGLLKNKKDVLNTNIIEFISQYNTNLRRHIVGNSEIEQICKSIYQKHSKALDLIFQHRPDIHQELSEFIQRKISNTEGFILDSSGKTIIRFTTKTLDQILPKVGEGWSKSKRILLYEFNNYDNELILRLIIGPGQSEYRDKLYSFTRDRSKKFNKANRKQSAKWHTIFQQKMLTKKDFEEKTSEELSDEIEKKWEKMVSDIKDIDSLFNEQWRT